MVGHDYRPLTFSRAAMNENNTQTTLSPQPSTIPDPLMQTKQPKKPKEYGGPKGPEPTRYGDWEKAGRCIDF